MPLTAATSVDAAATAREEGRPVEVLDERTEDTSVFALPDGTMAVTVASGPVRVRTGNTGEAGDWVPIDPTLHVNADGDFVPGAHPWDITISAGTHARGASTSTPVVTMGHEGVAESQISWSGGPLPEPRVEGARAIYEDVMPDVDMVIDVTFTGVEQFFVIKERPARGRTLSFPVDLSVANGQVSERADGVLETRSAGGDLVAVGAQPLMWDAATDEQLVHPLTSTWEPLDPEASTLSRMTAWAESAAAGEPALSVDLDQAQRLGPAQAPSTAPPAGGDGADGAPAAPLDRVEVDRRVTQRTPAAIRVDLVPQESFLADPATVYPVVVDPEVSAFGGFDTFVQSNVANSDLSGNTELLMGTWDGGATRARSFVHFPISSLHHWTVEYAGMAIYNHHSWSCSARNWQVWDVSLASTATRWSNQPTWEGHYSTSSQTLGGGSCAGGWVYADITTLAVQWAKRTNTPVEAVGLMAANESDNYGWKRFYASESGAGPYYAAVVRNDPPTVPTALSVSPTTQSANGVAYTNTPTPTLRAVAHDPNGTVAVYFEVRANGVQLANGQVTSSDGATAEWTVPAGLLLEGQTYTFRALGWDGEHQSAFSADYALAVQRAPNAPTGARTTSPATSCTTGAGRPYASATDPTLRAVLSDSDGANVAGRFTLTDLTSGTVVWAPQDTAPRSSGTEHSVTVPGGVLADGGAYRWDVRAVDGTGAIGPVVVCEFTVDLTGPAGPAEVVAVAPGDLPIARRDFAVTTAVGGVAQARAWVRSVSGTTSGRVCLSSTTNPPQASCTPYSVGTTWQPIGVSLGPSAATSSVRMEVFSDDAVPQVRLDDVWVAGVTSLANGSFEQGTSGWSGMAPAAFEVRQDATSAHSGQRFGIVSRPGTTGSARQDLLISAAPGETVRGLVWLRSATGTTTGTVCLWGLPSTVGSCSNYTVGTTWTPVSLTLGVNVAQGTFRLEIYPTGGAAATWFDDATVAKWSELANGSFEQSSAAWGVTAPANFVVYNNPSIAHTGSYFGATNRAGVDGSVRNDTAMNLAAGELLEAQVWMRAEAGTATGSLCLWGVGVTANENGCTWYTVTAGTWQLVTVSLGARSAHSMVRFEIYPQGGSPTLWWDDVTLIRRASSVADTFETGVGAWTAIAPGTITPATNALHSGAQGAMISRPQMAVYAEDTSTGARGITGAFVFGGAEAGTTRFAYSFDDDALASTVSVGPSTTPILFTPDDLGPHTLSVAQVDRAGQVGPVRLYRFIVGPENAMAGAALASTTGEAPAPFTVDGISTWLRGLASEVSIGDLRRWATAMGTEPDDAVSGDAQTGEDR